jgi:hypothetical protein
MKHHLTLGALAFCSFLLAAPSVSAQTKGKVIPKVGSKPAPDAKAIERLKELQRVRANETVRLALAKVKLEYKNRALNSAREEKKSPMIHKPNKKYRYLGYKSSK